LEGRLFTERLAPGDNAEHVAQKLLREKHGKRSSLGRWSAISISLNVRMLATSSFSRPSRLFTSAQCSLGCPALDAR